jgi:hypothetical protein
MRGPQCPRPISSRIISTLAMPITSAVDSTGRFTVVSVIDPYTIEDWCNEMLLVWDSPAFREHRALLIDRRQAEPLSVAFVDSMTSFLSEHHTKIAGTRTAIVVRDNTGFGMGRMTELRASIESPDAVIRPFRDYDEAVRWLTAS